MHGHSHSWSLDLLERKTLTTIWCLKLIHLTCSLLFLCSEALPQVCFVLNICSKIAGEDPCGSVVSIIKLHGNSMEIMLPDGHFPVNLLNILRTPFYKNTFEELLLYMSTEYIRPVLSKVQNFFLENIRKNARKITTSFCWLKAFEYDFVRFFV